MTDRTTTRLDTAARWDAALDRALTECVRIYRDLATGAFSALGKDGHTLYSVSYYTCSCQAGQGADPVCQHRAAFRAHCQKEVVFTEPFLIDEPTPAEPAHFADLIVTVDEDGETEGSALLAPLRFHKMCTDCLDTGWSRVYLGFNLNDYVEHPCRCGADTAA